MKLVDSEGHPEGKPVHFIDGPGTDTYEVVGDQNIREGDFVGVMEDGGIWPLPDNISAEQAHTLIRLLQLATDPGAVRAMSDLPTRTAIFVNTRDALDRASSALSDARDWLHSDWAPVGSELTPEAAAARSAIFRAIREAKVRIAAAKGDAGTAIESLAASP